MRMVFDSSSIILLAKISMLNIVAKNFECVITKDVKKECTHKKDYQDAKIITRLINEGLLHVENINVAKNMEYEFRLGKGEASSITLALKEKTVLATDDKAAIKACKIFGIGFVTSIDFVLRAFEKDKITSEEAKTKISKLDEYGRYSTEIIKNALETIGGKNEQSSKSQA
ncbi:MAG: hypothetical protein WC613_04705 [Candidatus Aenigmatarchaeota archaeon]